MQIEVSVDKKQVLKSKIYVLIEIISNRLNINCLIFVYNNVMKFTIHSLVGIQLLAK